jgi:pimeloyl-ACP methyl ester carboxylesterase
MKIEHAITEVLMLFAAIFLLSIPLVSLAADQPKVDNEPHMVKLADAKIEYFSQGQGDVVVLLPGGGLNVSYMEGLAQSLSKAGYRAVRINSRGAGTSKSAVDTVTLHDLAGDVAGVIEALDLGPVHVAGHAFGNRVARMLAADHPELLRSVILLAAGGKVAATPEADAALKVVFSPTSTDEAYLAAMEYMVGDPKDTKIAGEALRRSRAPEAGGIQFRAATTVELDDWWAPAGKIRYLALQGSHDQAAPPENGILLRKDLGDRVTLVSLKGAGHLMLVTRPQETGKEIVTFLKSLPAE